jgi:chemotaxis protein methyltransferase CheR
MTLSNRLEPRPQLAPREFRLLRDLFNKYAGLHFDDDDLQIFERRLSRRVVALELAGFDEYYKYLRFDVRGRAELEEAIELLTTNETYFFRQEYQLRAFRNQVLPLLAEANQRKRRLNLWSAGCSTGEEAYTIAIVIHESRLFEGWEVRVIGSDISRRSVAAARRGVYQGPSFRVMSESRQRMYFADANDGMHIVEPIKRMCHFGQLNLLDGTAAAIVGLMDAVFCRNVLIYFDMRSRRRVIDNLYARLSVGGYLLLGHSESLLNVSTAFELVHLKEDLVYRKPLVTERWEEKERR